MANTINIVVPDLGDFDDVEVIEVLVGAGDQVAKEDGLITLETDKATMDVPAADAGAIEEITVSAGDKVSSGDVIGRITIESSADNSSAKAEPELVAADTSADAEPTVPPAGSVADKSSPVTMSVPDIGDFADVDVIEVHVAPGDEVQVEDPLVTLETDKAAMEVPATAAGKVDQVLVSVGDKVSEGSAIAVVDAVAGSTSEPAAPRVPATSPAQVMEQAAVVTPSAPVQQASGVLPTIDESGFSRAHASPSVRKLARELGVDLVQVKGSGAKERVLHDDVKAFVKAILTGGAMLAGAGSALPKVPVVDFAKFGEIDIQPLNRIQKIAGPRLQASWINLPHVTQHDLADITGLEERRQELKGPAKERGIGLTPLAFIMKACIASLREFPKANSSLSADGSSLVYKNYYHLGFAADTENGLVVPVIRNADKMDVYELATALGELSAKARDGKLKADEMQGASFTISSLGGIGGTAFTPIVNAPEVAILGVSRSSMQPVWNGESFEPRLMLPLSLSYDHRVIDGAMAARFTTHLSQALSNVDVLLQAIP